MLRMSGFPLALQGQSREPGTKGMEPEGFWENSSALGAGHGPVPALWGQTSASAFENTSSPAGGDPSSLPEVFPF